MTSRGTSKIPKLRTTTPPSPVPSTPSAPPKSPAQSPKFAFTKSPIPEAATPIPTPRRHAPWLPSAIPVSSESPVDPTKVVSTVYETHASEIINPEEAAPIGVTGINIETPTHEDSQVAPLQKSHSSHVKIPTPPVNNGNDANEDALPKGISHVGDPLSQQELDIILHETAMIASTAAEMKKEEEILYLSELHGKSKSGHMHTDQFMAPGEAPKAQSYHEIKKEEEAEQQRYPTLIQPKTCAEDRKFDAKLSEKENLVADVNVLLPPTAIKTDSITTLSPEQAPQPVPSFSLKHETPSYLELYRSKMLEQEEREKSLRKDSSDSVRGMKREPQLTPNAKSGESMEWDYDDVQHWDFRSGKEVCTQTSSTLNPKKPLLEQTFSRESLLEDAKPPSETCGLTTEIEEESDAYFEEVTRNWKMNVAGNLVSETDYSENETHPEFEEEEFSEGAFMDSMDFPKARMTGRKTKTIFSLELPMTESKIESGSGENGDGHDVIPSGLHKLKSITSVSVQNREESFTILKGADEKFEVNTKRNRRGQRPKLEEWQAEHLVPLISTGIGDCIEIRPSPVPSSEQELRSRNRKSSEKVESISSTASGVEERRCCAILPKSSTMVLQRTASCKHGPVFRNAIKIHNATSFVHGFKIICNAAVQDSVKITPRYGEIQPHSELYVDIKTDPRKMGKRELEAKAKIDVQIFRLYCDSPSEIPEFYQKLCEQQPDLIKTQTIEKILLWDSTDLTGTMNLIKSIKDDEEREAVKMQVHRQNSEKQLHESRTKAEMTSIKRMMLAANEGLLRLSQELTVIRKVLIILIFLAIILFGIGVLPFLYNEVIVTDEEEQVEPEVELGYYDMFVNQMKDAYDSITSIFTSSQ